MRAKSGPQGWRTPGLLGSLPEERAILDPGNYDAWLKAVVSTRVNSPRNDDAALLELEGEPLAAQGTLV